MADVVENLMTPVWLDSQEQLTSWLGLVRSAYDDDDASEQSVADFDNRFRAAASAWPGETVNGFLAAVAARSDGVGEVGELLATLESTPNVYWELRQRLYPEPEAAPVAAPVDRFGWLAGYQSRKLSDNWGDEWRTSLGEQLDYRWGAGWEATYGNEASRGYLDELIAEWLPDSTAEAAEPAPSPEQVTEMIDDAIHAAVESTPGAEDLTGKELAEIAAEVRAEVTGGDQ